MTKSEHHYKVTFSWQERAAMATERATYPAAMLTMRAARRVMGWWRWLAMVTKAALLALWAWVVDALIERPWSDDEHRVASLQARVEGFEDEHGGEA